MKSNIWNALIILVIMTKNIVGEIIGSVIWKNCAQKPAPSISEAS